MTNYQTTGQDDIRYVTYLRASTDEKKQAVSLEVQRQMVAEYARKYGGRIVAEYAEYVSGKKLGRTRKGPLAEAIQRCQRDRCILLAATLDRIGRQAAEVLHTISNSGIDVRVADDPTMSMLTAGIKAVLAEHEGKRISERIKAALAVKIEQGVKIGGANPKMWESAEKNHPGFKKRWFKNGPAASAKKSLEEREKWAPIAEEAMKLREAGASLPEVALYLNAKGYRNRRGNPFNVATVMYLIRIFGGDYRPPSKEHFKDVKPFDIKAALKDLENGVSAE